MGAKSAFFSVLIGAAAFGILWYVTPRRSTTTTVSVPPRGGRFQLVELHPNRADAWSGILDTETGCTWVYASQTPPTDAELKAAPAGEEAAWKIYEKDLGRNYFAIVAYESNGPAMTSPDEPQPSTAGATEFETVGAQEYYCDEARQNALRAAAP